MLHFIHTADWQIGRQYGQFDDEDALPLAEARIDTVAAIARLATERQVDAVLVAGDVFDTQAVGERTIRRLFAALEGYKGPWIMIAGNHDAALTESVWTRARQLGCVPENVVLPESAGCPSIAIAQGRAHVLAASLTQRHTYDDVSAVFDGLDTPDGCVRIGLAHGSVTGQLPATIDSANPIAPDRADTARLDYLGLGDWHGVMSVSPRVWYAGTPEPDRFRNNESGSVLAVRIKTPGAAPEVEVVSVGRYRWRHWTRHMALATDLDTLVHELEQLGSADVLRIDLTGSLTLAQWDTLQQHVGRTLARLRALRLDTVGLVLNPDEDDMSALGADGYVGVVAAELQALQDMPQADPGVAREALRLLMQFQRETSAAQGGQS